MAGSDLLDTMKTNNNLSRREFLKLSSAVALGTSLPTFSLASSLKNNSDTRKNILIVVFDALSANHLSFHGYSRKTTPNITRLLERAIVYHNHYSAGNFTTTGTASLLTGTYPWTHRALQINGKVAPHFKENNIFNLFSDHYSMVYSHNILVNTLLHQFQFAIDNLTKRNKLLINNGNLISKVFLNDEFTATDSYEIAFRQEKFGHTYSLFFSRFSRLLNKYRQAQLLKYAPSFPRGLPNSGYNNYYILDHAIEHLINSLANVPQPFLGYYHFFPPHAPYNTIMEYTNIFSEDKRNGIFKPKNNFSDDKSPEFLRKMQNWYDEFILYADSQFAKLFNFLENAGLLENTWLILTSDHGELFERGVLGHNTPLLYEPVVRIPLVIFEPNRRARKDIYQFSSAIDILPTLLSQNNRKIPSWVEGQVLPPFQDQSVDIRRNLFAVRSDATLHNDPINEGSIMLIRDNYKMTYYFGYNKLGKEDEFIELFDLKSDSEELHNQYASQNKLASEMLSIIKTKLMDVNQPFIR